ncbi:MAG: translation initiation factor IF-2 [Nanoarchaeota archaeon]|nr:translation initiation factor IF-2 [Nanoarchaeota archaeon]
MEKKLGITKLRSPIVTIVGHVDHGKTSILDYFRGTSVQEGEAGGITQKISYTKFPIERIREASPLLDAKGVKLEIPGFLFIDTPGHAAFTNLRKRGGSLADLAIVVVAIKEGIQPQTAEVLQILKTYKTPFLIALNKVDTISGWRKKGDLKNSIDSQSINVAQEFQESLLTFQGALNEHGFDSDLYYDIGDFTKKIAIVPCSARTGEGISELLFVLSGLCQRFLKEKLKVSQEAKGVILEIKKEKTIDYVESILYDGKLEIGDEVAIASFGEPILSKIRSLEEIEPLTFKYKSVKGVNAATGVRIHLTNKEGILPGMPFQKINNDFEDLKKTFRKEVSGALNTDKQGIIVKADSLGSLDALLSLLRQGNIRIVKAGIGPIGNGDIISAKANLDIDPLDAIIVGFNVGVEEELELGKVKVITGDVVYKLIDDLEKWRRIKADEIEKSKLMEMETISKLEILPQYIFRNSNPAIFGVRVVGGKIRVGIPLIDDKGEEVARVKGLEHEKKSVKGASEGQELAISLPGINFERRLKEIKYLYSYVSRNGMKKFKEHRDLLSSKEKSVLSEIAELEKMS